MVQCHKPPKNGNGKQATYTNGDDSRMVNMTSFYHVLPTLVIIFPLNPTRKMLTNQPWSGPKDLRLALPGQFFGTLPFVLGRAGGKAACSGDGGLGVWTWRDLPELWGLIFGDFLTWLNYVKLCPV
jgi:hypothetical protein